MAKINEIDDQRDSSRGQSSTFAPTLPHPIGASSTFNRTDTFGHEHVPGQDETQAFTPGLSGTGPGGGSDSRDPFRVPWAATPQHRYPPPDASKFSEYEKKYPPDKYGEELKSNARVFKVYRDVVVDQDNLLLHGWHETLNVILIFAGLFSAILTGFLVESSKQLRPDNSEITAKAVLAILARVEGVNGTNAASISTPFVPPPGAIAVNRAWFASLSLALTVSLVAILAKQWLLEYTSTMRSSTGDARGWAWRHVMLRDGLSKWGINALISWLAVFLHISLFLFFGGLAVFVRGLDAGVYVFMVILTTSTVVLYCASFIAPLIWPECPSGTHFHKNVPGWFPPLFDGVVETTFTLATAILLTPILLFMLFSIFCRDILLGSPTEYFWIGSILSWAKKLRHRPIRLNLRVVSSEEHRLTVAALKWMIDPDTRLPDEAVVVAVDAIGAIDVQLHRAVYGDRNPLRSKQVADAVEQRYLSLFQIAPSDSIHKEVATGRVLRSWIVAQRPVDEHEASQLADLLVIQTHDVAVLADALIATQSGFRATGCYPREALAHLAMSTMADPVPHKFQSTTHRLIFSPQLSHARLSILSAITQSQFTAAVVAICLSPIRPVTIDRTSQWDPQVTRLIHALEPHRPEFQHARWEVTMIVFLSLAILYAHQQKFEQSDLRMMEHAYRCMLYTTMAEHVDIYHVQAVLLPFSLDTDFVQSCPDSLVEVAQGIFQKLLINRTQWPVWSNGLVKIMFQLLQRQLTITNSRSIASAWHLAEGTLPMDFHRNIVTKFLESGDVNNFLINRSINVLWQQAGTPVGWSSTWKLYLSQVKFTFFADTEAAMMFAIELAVLSRLGLESDRANSLLCQLVGGDRGIQIMRGSTRNFVTTAVHAKMVDPRWWGSMKRRILRLSSATWNDRSRQEEHTTPQQLVDEIEAIEPCESCVASALQLRQHPRVETGTGTGPGDQILEDEGQGGSSAPLAIATQETDSTDPGLIEPAAMAAAIANLHTGLDVGSIGRVVGHDDASAVVVPVRDLEMGRVIREDSVDGEL